MSLSEPKVSLGEWGEGLRHTRRATNPLTLRL
jgi:hypothetical protein